MAPFSFSKSAQAKASRERFVFYNKSIKHENARTIQNTSPIRSYFILMISLNHETVYRRCNGSQKDNSWRSIILSAAIFIRKKFHWTSPFTLQTIGRSGHWSCSKTMRKITASANALRCLVASMSTWSFFNHLIKEGHWCCISLILSHLCGTHLCLISQGYSLYAVHFWNWLALIILFKVSLLVLPINHLHRDYFRDAGVEIVPIYRAIMALSYIVHNPSGSERSPI